MALCQETFSVNAAFHARNRRATHDMKEHGGNAVIDYDNKEINEGDLALGGYNYVSMPRGTVDWHSHPRTCQSDKVCAVGIPSPTDMISITLGILYGTQVHLVYSAEGTYAIRLQPRSLVFLQRGKKEVKDFCFQIHQTLNRLHKHFVGSGQTYKSYQKAWLQTVDQLGFHIDFFPGDRTPVFTLTHTCSFKGRRIETIHINPDLQKAVKFEAKKMTRRKKKSRAKTKTKAVHGRKKLLSNKRRHKR